MLTLRGHSGPVQSLAYSPDGRLLASGGHDHVVRIWDLERRRQLPHFACLSGGSIAAVAFSPGGTTLAAVSNMHGGLWDVAERRALPTPPRQFLGSLSSLAFLPDGRALAIGYGIYCLAIRGDGLIAVGAGHADDSARWPSTPRGRGAVMICDLATLRRLRAAIPERYGLLECRLPGRGGA
jgi:WD40 repeat protein